MSTAAHMYEREKISSFAVSAWKWINGGFIIVASLLMQTVEFFRVRCMTGLNSSLSHAFDFSYLFI